MPDVARPEEKQCFHDELRRARSDTTDGYIDVWYCPEPSCDFEINRCEHRSQRQGELGLPYCADCGQECVL